MGQPHRHSMPKAAALSNPGMPRLSPGCSGARIDSDRGIRVVEQDQLFERLWAGDAAMEEWTATVSGGSAKAISDDIIAIHTGYLFGNATAIRTSDGLVLVDTGSRETASETLASCAGGMMARFTP
jgi:hypothetical protein